MEGASITTAAETLKASGMRSSGEVGNPSTNANLDLPPNPHSPGSYQGEDTVKDLDGRSLFRGKMALVVARRIHWRRSEMEVRRPRRKVVS